MVYVDDYNKAYGRMKMCHMIADTSFELISMARKIGVKPKWIQDANTPKEHFDVSAMAKKKALKLGAVAISRRTLTRMVALRKTEIRTYPFVINKRKSVKIEANSLENAINKVLALYPGQKVTTTYARNMEKYRTRLNDKEHVLVTRYNNGVSGASVIADEDIMEEIVPHITTKLKHKLFMDLQKARKQAIEKSQKEKGTTFYINVVPAGEPNEGDCDVEKEWNENTYAAFRNGSEVAVPVKAKAAEKPTKANLKKAEKEAAALKASSNNKSKSMATVKTTPTKKEVASKQAATKAATKAPAKQAAAPAKAPKGKKNMTIKEIIKLTKGGTKVLNHADKVLTLGYLEKMKDHSRLMAVSY